MSASAITTLPTWVAVDDHPSVIDGWRRSWRRELNLVGVAHDSECGEAVAVRMRPDVVTMDFGLPGNPWRATRSIVEDTGGETRVIIVTGSSAPTIVDLAIEAGASGLASKGVIGQSLVAAIVRVANGGEFWGDLWRDRADTILAGELPPSLFLSRMEERLVNGLAAGLTLVDLSELWSEPLTIVERRAADLRHRFGVSNDTALVHQAIATGATPGEAL